MIYRIQKNGQYMPMVFESAAAAAAHVEHAIEAEKGASINRDREDGWIEYVSSRGEPRGMSVVVEDQERTMIARWHHGVRCTWRLAVGGGVNRASVGLSHRMVTTDEVRAWAESIGPRLVLREDDRVALIARVDAAIANGGGSGSAGRYAIGIAQGLPKVTFALHHLP